MPINCYEFQICRGSDNCSCKLVSAQKASLYNADWLRRSVRNPAVLMALRGIAKTGGISLSDNESVINLVAGQIASGQLRVCQGQTAASGRANDPGSTSSQAGGPSKPFPFTPRSKTAATSSQPSQNDPQSLPDDLDGSTQAGVLNSAANRGTPFCAECAKNQAANSAASQ